MKGGGDYQLIKISAYLRDLGGKLALRLLQSIRELSESRPRLGDWEISEGMSYFCFIHQLWNSKELLPSG
jgi:hypothetical protein